MPHQFAQLGSDAPDLLTAGLTLVISLLVLAMAVTVGWGFFYREQHVWGSALSLGSLAGALFGPLWLAVRAADDRPDIDLLDSMLRTLGKIWLVGMTVAAIRLVQERSDSADPLPHSQPTLAGLFARYVLYNTLGFIVGGMLGLMCVMLVTSQLASHCVEARRLGAGSAPEADEP